MATVTVILAHVDSESTPGVAVVELRQAGYVATLITGADRQETEGVESYDECLAVAMAHADSIDNTEVSDKATRADFARQLKERDATIAALQAQLADKAEVAVIR